LEILIVGNKSTVALAYHADAVAPVKAVEKICPEQLHLSIKRRSSSNSQRFFCTLRTDDYTTGGGSGTYDHTCSIPNERHAPGRKVSR
jgi:hypothetical protein